MWTRRRQHFKFVSLAITFRSQRVKKQKYIVLQMEAIFVRAPGGNCLMMVLSGQSRIERNSTLKYSAKLCSRGFSQAIEMIEAEEKRRRGLGGRLFIYGVKGANSGLSHVPERRSSATRRHRSKRGILYLCNQSVKYILEK